MRAWETCKSRIKSESCTLTYGVGKNTYTYETNARCIEEAIDNLFHDLEFASLNEIRLISVIFTFGQQENTI